MPLDSLIIEHNDIYRVGGGGAGAGVDGDGSCSSCCCFGRGCCLCAAKRYLVRDVSLSELGCSYFGNLFDKLTDKSAP